MTRVALVSTASLLAALTGGTASAAAISLSSAAFTNANQVSTNGTLIQAVNLGQGTEDAALQVNNGVATSAITVNGVTFAPDSGDGVGFFAVDVGGAVAPFTFKADDANDWHNTSLYDSAANPITGLSAADANQLLDSVEFGGGVGNSTARLTGLTIGQAYEVQVIVARVGAAYDFGYATPSGDATEVYTLTGVAGGPPSIVTGTFTATETVQDLHVAIVGNANLEASAFQLRQVPEPGSLALLSLGGMALLRRRRG